MRVELAGRERGDVRGWAGGVSGRLTKAHTGLFGCLLGIFLFDSLLFLL